MDTNRTQASTDGLDVVAWSGSNKVLLAMSVDAAKLGAPATSLAGFAIWRKYAGQAERVLPNRISFSAGVSQATTSATRTWTPSSAAPFQKFRWVDVPPQGFDAPLRYRVRAMYFDGNRTALRDGPEVSLKVEPARTRYGRFHVAFTRGFIASQAYADRFHNAEVRPSGPKTLDYDTQPFEDRYAWLGADAHRALYDFIDDCLHDTQCKVDVFAYDLDLPDVVRALVELGKQRRLRAILDDAPLHSQANDAGAFPLEVEAAHRIVAAAGAANVRQGHFGRFQHHKIFIKRDRDGNAQRVLLGSMNFSVRGVYVQANNIIVVDDPAVAAHFGATFDAAFASNVARAAFAKNAISAHYIEGAAQAGAELPRFSVAFSPHASATVSLAPMAQRIREAQRSVLFAVMEPDGTGPVLASLRSIAAQPTVFSYGTVETDSGLGVQNPDGALGDLTGFAALTKNVPPPFSTETGGGAGMHIHDKFVVVDFDRANPTVFTGSSNLAQGGEEQNGDSLLMIEDATIATMYAIEAVAMFDHFHFRKKMQQFKPAQPFTLWYPGKPGQPTPWWQRYYDPKSIQMRDRLLFAAQPLPAGLAATKNVDWSGLDAAAAAAKKAKKSPKKIVDAAQMQVKRAPAAARPRATAAKKARTSVPGKLLPSTRARRTRSRA